MSKLKNKLKKLIKEQLYPDQDTDRAPIQRPGQRGDEVTGPVIDDFGVCPCGDGTFSAACCTSVTADKIEDKTIPVLYTPPGAQDPVWRIISRSPSDLTTSQNFIQEDCN
jgi:hypothetical protein